MQRDDCALAVFITFVTLLHPANMFSIVRSKRLKLKERIFLQSQQIKPSRPRNMDLYKTALCDYWAAGMPCRFGDRCWWVSSDIIQLCKVVEEEKKMVVSFICLWFQIYYLISVLKLIIGGTKSNLKFYWLAACFLLSPPRFSWKVSKTDAPGWPYIHECVLSGLEIVLAEVVLSFLVHLTMR